MLLWVGLGNPGAKYAGNRHNIGFMAMDRIASDHGFGPWRAKFQGQVSEGRLGSTRVVLLKPETFMNNSGRSVRAAADFYKVEIGDITVFHDELDIAPGKCRLKTGGGHAGHNGLRSIHAHLSPDYHRVRLGVGHPGQKNLVANYVLGDFPKEQREMLDELMRGLSEGAPALAAGDGARFLNAVSLRVAPPRSSGGIHPERGTHSAPTDKAPKDPAPKPKAAPKAEPDPNPETLSPLERLAQKFGK